MNAEDYKTAITKNISISIQTFCFGVAIGLLASFFLGPSKKPKSEICKNEIAQNSKLSEQLSSLRQEFSLEKQKILFRCKQDSRDQALKKIEAYKKVCETLRCQICKAAKK